MIPALALAVLSLCMLRRIKRLLLIPRTFDGKGTAMKDMLCSSMHRPNAQMPTTKLCLEKKTLWVFTWWKCLWFWQWELETVNGTRNHRLQRSQKLAACGTKSKGYELSLHKKKGIIGTLCSFVWEGQPNKLRIWTVWWNWKAWNGESTCQSGNERQVLGEDVWFQHWSKQTLHGYL